MWGRRKKRRARLPRQLALGLLQDALGRVDERQRQPDPAAGPPARDQPPLVPKQPGSVSPPTDASTQVR
jgi:hypothetical protein